MIERQLIVAAFRDFVHKGIGDMSDIFSVNTNTGTSTSLVLELSGDDQTSTSELMTTTVVGTGTPDDSDGVGGTLEGIADAVGTNTIAGVTVTGEASDDGTVATLDFDVSALAASEVPGSEGAFAIAITDASVSDGTEVMFVSTVASGFTEESPDGSVSVAVSETSVVAVDIDLSDFGNSDGGGVSDSAIDDTASIDPDIGGESPVASDQPVSSESPTNDELVDLIDGNIAFAEVDVTIEGTDTFLEVDVYALALEDELSTSGAFVDYSMSG